MPLLPRLPFGRDRLPGPVFVSYRRADTAAYSGRIYDALVRRFGSDCVFMDLEGIDIAADFVEVIDRSVRSSSVLLAVIGQEWLRTPPAEDGAPPREDYVLRELATALAAGIPVFPVLVDGAKLPLPESLPGTVRRLVQLNAIELSDARWSYDVQRLIDAVERRARERAGGGGGTARSRPAVRAAKVAGPLSLLLALGIWGVPKLRSGALAEPAEQQLEAETVACRSRDFPMVYADSMRLFIDQVRFMEGYEAQFGKQPELARSGLGTVLSLIASDTSITDGRWAAYVLATIKNETGQTWWPIEEFGKGKGHKYGQPVTVVDSFGNRYTNTYYGRGYVALTWEENYRSMGNAIDKPLLYDPSLALEADAAYAVVSYGMRKGQFTGRKLSEYVNGEICDYVEARRVINGTDRAYSIAADAAKLEEILSRSIAPRRYTVLPDTLRVHVRADTASMSGGVLTRGMVVSLVNVQGRWRQVERSGLRGWVSAAALRPVAAAGLEGRSANPPAPSGAPSP